MSSLGIFNKETKTYQKVAGTAEAAVVDAEMSDTSTNTVQNKVIKKYVDDKQVNIDGVTLTLDEARNVIKLADTLKDKIGSALQPESIVNNHVTTETGFALDARQANPNIDGTLANQISQLNTDLGIRSGSWEPTVEHGTITSYYTKYYKIGKLVNVSCAIWGSGDGTDNIVTVSLPFVVRNIRVYGCVGYFPASSNYPNLHVVSSENLDRLAFEYGTTTNVTNIKGKEWGTCQFSMTYITD